MSIQEQKLASVKKSCRLAKNISKVLSAILTVAGFVSAVGGALIYTFSDKVNAVAASHPENINISNAEIHGMLSLTINLESMVERGQYAQAMMTGCLFAAVLCFIVSVVISLISKSLALLETSETPFNAGILENLKTAFIILTVIVAVFTGFGIGVLVGLCLWCVYCIMDYGCALQEEIDETV